MKKRILFFLLVMALVLSACQPKDPAPTPAATAAGAETTPLPGGAAPDATAPTPEAAYAAPEKPAAVVTEIVPEAAAPYPAVGIPAGPVTFAGPGGAQLAGAVSGSGSTGVILAHQNGGSKEDWQPMSFELASAGFVVLEFDFRGFGQTGGSQNIQALDEDIAAAAAYLKSLGITKIICIGASMGGTACVKSAAGVPLAGLVVISSPLEMENPLVVTSEMLSGLAIPKLFVAARDDKPYIDDVQQMYDWSAEPRQIEILEGNNHGTDIFYGDQAGVLGGLILDFVRAIP